MRVYCESAVKKCLFTKCLGIDRLNAKSKIDRKVLRMMRRIKAVSKEVAVTHRKQTLRLMRRNWLLYVFLIPALVYVICFEYAPMYGLQIAFKNYSFAKGFSDSKWVGLTWFKTFFNTPRF